MKASKSKLPVALMACADRGATPSSGQQVRDEAVGFVAVELCKVRHAQNPIGVDAVGAHEHYLVVEARHIRFPPIADKQIWQIGQPGPTSVDAGSQQACGGGPGCP